MALRCLLPENCFFPDRLTRFFVVDRLVRRFIAFLVSGPRSSLQIAFDELQIRVLLGVALSQCIIQNVVDHTSGSSHACMHTSIYRAQLYTACLATVIFEYQSSTKSASRSWWNKMLERGCSTVHVDPTDTHSMSKSASLGHNI